jgi:ABC-type transport system involved in multi-copper enzyme maturation permease subunit
MKGKSVGQIWLLSKITFKEGVRNRILLGIVLVSVLFSAFNLIFSQMFAHDISKVSVDLGLSTVSVAGLVVIFFMGINLLAKDFEKRTIYMILARPLGRWQYVLGKYFGLALMVGTAVIILGLVVAAGVKVSMSMAPNHIPETYSWRIFFLSIGFSYLGLMVLTALAQLFTYLTTSSFIALLVTACTYFIGQNVEFIRKTFLGGDGVNVVYYYLIEAVTWIFPNLQAFDLKTAAGYGLPLEPIALLWTAVYAVSYIGIILALTVFVFQRRELS